MNELAPVTMCCKNCGHEGPQPATRRLDGVHFVDIRCAKCGKHLGFQPKPESDPTKYKRPNQHRDLVREYSCGYCEMCLKKKDDLPKGQTLEAQHVIEYQDGGTSDRGNIWIVCTGCHRLVHWIRTYHGIVHDLAGNLTEWKNADQRS